MIRKPKITGGIILGMRGKRPMAVADEPESDVVFSDPSVIYSAVPQICGFPWRIDSDGEFSIGPITGPQTGILAAEITTRLDVNGSGAQICLLERYSQSVANDGGSYSWDGGVTDASAEIVIRPYDNTSDENVAPALDPGTGVATPATSMWQLAIVKYYEGQYYLCITLNPPNNGVPSVKVFPTEFDTANPL